jgi:hypothetical protein
VTKSDGFFEQLDIFLLGQKFFMHIEEEILFFQTP